MYESGPNYNNNRASDINRYYEMGKHLHEILHLSSLNDILELALLGGREAAVEGLIVNKETDSLTRRGSEVNAHESIVLRKSNCSGGRVTSLL